MVASIKSLITISDVYPHSVGQMSINQAAIHYNLPYSSLYGRFKRGKYDVVANTSGVALLNTSGNTTGSIEIIEHSQENSVRSQSQYAAEKLKANANAANQL